MGEVTVEADSAVTKQDSSSGPLPEPLLIIMSPPPPFLPVPGEPTMLWRRWLKAFEHYVEVLGENELVDSSKCGLLRDCLGREGRRVSAALIPSETAYEAAVSALTVYFGSDRSSFRKVSVDNGDGLDPTVQIKRKRGRPRRGEGRPKNLPEPGGSKTTRSPRYKDNYLLLQKDDVAKRADEACNNTLRTEEEGCDNGRKGDEEDEDFHPSKLKGPYCTLCVDKRFRDANKLARHMRTHTKEKPFRCPACVMTFSQSYHMTRHMRKQHGAGRYVCPTCGKSSETSAGLQSHKRTHAAAQVLSRPACREKSPNAGEFCSRVATRGEDHLSQTQERSSQRGNCVKNKDGNDSIAKNDADSDGDTQDKESTVIVETEEKDTDGGQSKDGDDTKEKAASGTKSKGHFCPICVGRRFRGPNKLARHMRTHTKEKPFSCPVCALTFSQSYHMTRHTRKQHGLVQYICDKCGESSGSWLELKAHKKTHTVDCLRCPACDKPFKEKAALVSHLRIHKKVPSSPRSLVCSDCGKVFGRMYHLKRHIVTHRKATNGEVYACPDCQKNFAFPEDLSKHAEIHVKENNGTCPKCNETFRSPEELETHMGAHERSYACHTCGKKFKVEYALKKHEQGHQDEQYYCSLCRRRFIKLSHYKRHVMVHDRRESRCPHCDGVFLQVTALKYHLRTHTEERPHQCTCCIETFEEKEELEQHRLKHRKFKLERPYSCTRCDSAFSNLIELTDHMSSHDGEQPLNCPVCGKTFLNKSKLEKHLGIHSGERPHLCSVCGNGFPSAASLKLHVHIHTGEKPFRCPQCGKSFRSSSGLRLHGRQHMEVRPSYECPECGRTYGRMTELKMHQRYHTGDKPHACSCCSKRFISKDKLNVHMRIHTGERPYSCPHCGQTFTQTGDRNRHISKYH
uniref:zinc finger protein 569-like n=1 Tax=Gasterosteus aculeatus aculeatus TaxID=481459 RepID=UPI001A98DEE2|nr:zinc finger protein 569-like [Gasterosteus aculeatus aculeatus]XP_040042711.1 zinc finger protein 569-like [Gasterosteus aculeatus aculeatus]